MDRRELEQRTLVFAARAFRLIRELPPGIEKSIIGKQMLRAASSVGANYREANRAESRRDFAHKLAVTEKEAAEALYWLELLRETGAAEAAPGVDQLLEEAEELVRIFYVARRTMRRREKTSGHLVR